MEKIKISQAIIVEGKYDKIKLGSVVDAVIICTNGFQIYKDTETVELIKLYARTSGIIIITDSDTAGFRIRNHLKSVISDGRITNLYIPEIFGKEKRKTAPSREGKLGVEGIDPVLIRQVFENAGFLENSVEQKDVLSRNDMYELGLSGHPNSSLLRIAVCEQLGLPHNLAAKALLDYLNTAMTKQQAEQITALVKNKLANQEKV